jgi:hypothetical protein
MGASDADRRDSRLKSEDFQGSGAGGALAGWSVAFIGMLHHIVRSLTQPTRSDYDPAATG